MTCPKCGRQLNDGAGFCPGCGERIVNSNTSSMSSSKINHVPRNDKFWRFIWCDFVFIMMFLNFFLVIAGSGGMIIGPLKLISLALVLLPLIIARIQWKGNKIQSALTLLIIFFGVSFAVLGFPIVLVLVNYGRTVLSTVFFVFMMISVVILLSYAYVLFRILKDRKNQIANPYTADLAFIEFDGIKKIQMLFALASLVLFIVALFSPAYRYAASFRSDSLYQDSKSVFEQLGDNASTILLIINGIFAIILLRLSRIAFYIPLLFQIVLEIIAIVSLRNGIKTYGGGIASAGIYGGLGFYALIASVISAAATFVVLLFVGKKQTTTVPTYTTSLPPSNSCPNCGNPLNPGAVSFSVQWCCTSTLTSMHTHSPLSHTAFAVCPSLSTESIV